MLNPSVSHMGIAQRSQSRNFCHMG